MVSLRNRIKVISGTFDDLPLLLVSCILWYLMIFHALMYYYRAKRLSIIRFGEFSLSEALIEFCKLSVHHVNEVSI